MLIHEIADQSDANGAAHRWNRLINGLRKIADEVTHHGAVFGQTTAFVGESKAARPALAQVRIKALFETLESQTDRRLLAAQFLCGARDTAGFRDDRKILEEVPIQLRYGQI
ncbi:MAG: hypothetical protein WBP38_14055 [Hyphomicrobium sp.]